MVRTSSLINFVVFFTILATATPAAAQITHMYFDFNGSDPGSGVGPGGVGFNWSSSFGDLWSTSSEGTAQTQVWVDNSIAVIAAGTDCEGFGVGGSPVTGSSAPLVGGIRVEDCPFRINQNTLFLTGSSPELYQASGLSLLVRVLLNWPSSGVIRKTGPGTLEFDATSISSSGDGGSPSSTSFQIEQGLVQFESDNNDWFGGTSSASVTIGTVSNSATLQLLAADQLRNRTVIDLVNGTFNLTGNNETLRGLTGNGTVSGNGARLTLAPEGGDYSFAGAITNGSGATGLTLTGNGSQTLTASQSYSGETIIEGGGHLQVDGLPNSPAELVEGRLSVAEAVGSVTVRPQGQLRLGMPVGSISAGTLSWDGGGELIWQLGPSGTTGDSSLLTLSGALTTGSEGSLNIVLDPASELPPVAAQTYTLIEFDSTDAELADFSLQHNGLLDDRDYELQLTESALVLDIEVLDPLFSDRFEADQ